MLTTMTFTAMGAPSLLPEVPAAHANWPGNSNSISSVISSGPPIRDTYSRSQAFMLVVPLPGGIPTIVYNDVRPCTHGIQLACSVQLAALPARPKTDVPPIPFDARNRMSDWTERNLRRGQRTAQGGVRLCGPDLRWRLVLSTSSGEAGGRQRV